jgi:hypothetical protein
MMTVRGVLSSKHGRKLVADAVELYACGKDAVDSQIGYYALLYQQGIMGLEPRPSRLVASSGGLIRRGRNFLAARKDELRPIVCRSKAVRKFQDSELVTLVPVVAGEVAQAMHLPGSLVGLALAIALAIIRDGLGHFCSSFWQQ